MNEFQQTRIKQRLKLDFKKELNKKTEKKKMFSKTFRNELDILIQQLYLDGVHFYGFTIDLLYLKSISPENIWEMVHSDIESRIESIGLSIELIEFCYLSIELHQAQRLAKRFNKQIMLYTNSSLEGLPHIHGIIGVRSILGKNIHLDIGIKKYLRSIPNIEDVLLKKLPTIKSIKGYWNYCIKEHNFKFHRFVQYSNVYSELYGRIADLELTFDDYTAFGLDEFWFSPSKNISGIKIRNPEPKTLIIYILNLFMYHKNLKINKSKLYQQISDTKYSWKMVDNLNALQKNSILVFEYLKSIYPQQLESINTMEIISKNWNQVVEEIIQNNHYLSCINFKEDAIEFKDGIYFINENKFLNFKLDQKQLSLKMTGLNSCVFFDKSYHNLKKPEIWLSAITATVKNPDEFCKDFARYFHSENLEKLKKKSLVIVGKSNTGKTTLVANIINNVFGKENVGLIGKSDNFILEQLEDKKVIICDEFDYSKSNRGSLLKLMGNELDLINKKGVKKYSFVNKAPIVFLFNPKINKLMMEDDAFKNRFKHYEFENVINEALNDIDEYLKRELPNIIVYCNRLYFKDIDKKRLKISKKDDKKLMISDV